MATAFQVTFDCADPDALANFWAHALGYKLQDPPEGFASWEEWLEKMGIPKENWNSASAIVDPDGTGPRIYFQRVPEGKIAKNRMHLDLRLTGGPEAPIDQRRDAAAVERQRLIALGAREVAVKEERGEYWIVMQDPESNEFCIT